LEKAIQKEIESRLLYIDLSQQMVDEAAKEAFQQLAQQEQEHQNHLERYKSGELKEGALVSRQVIDYKIAEKLEHAPIYPEMTLKDTFLLAASREKASHEFYLGLAGIHPTGEVKKILEELATQELQHKQKVEFLFTEVAFPQTNGG